METKLTPFLFEGETLLRVEETDGKPKFALVDLCKILEIGNSRQAASRLDDDEKGVITIDTLGGPQELTVVTESGLYSLVLTSRKPAAKRFKKWITSEVLPSLRRTGTYTLHPEATQESLPNKPFDEWTLEEIRTHLSVANSYRHTLNNASAGWYLMRKGFPKPPDRLMPAYWQADMDLRQPRDGRSVTIIVPQGGEPN